MNSVTAFHEAIRPQKFASAAAARAALMKHPSSGDYLLDKLIEDGVLTVLHDGSVAGVAAKARKDPKDSVSATWGENWPSEGSLIECLEQGPAALKEIRETMRGWKQHCGHWVTLHALWRMMKNGDVVKSGKEYKLSPQFHARESAVREQGERDTEIMKDILILVGPPYPAAKVMALLQATDGHKWFEDSPVIEQSSVDYWVGQLIGPKPPA